jgi:hypothetical protein
MYGELVMNKSIKKIISAILVVALATLACSTVTISLTEPAITTLPATSQMDFPTETPPATDATSHEIYAGFTDDPSMPFVMIHQTGESLALTQDVDSSTVTGAVWISPDGSSVVIYSDKNGKPTGIVVGEQVILFSNYTADTVDLTVIKADGTAITAQSKLDKDILQKITAFDPSPSPNSLVSFSRSSLWQDELDQWFWMKTGLYMFDVAVCTTGALTIGTNPAAAGIFSVLVPATTLLLAKACTSALLGTLTRVGTILNIDVGSLQNISDAMSLISCVNAKTLLDLKACVKLLIPIAKEQEEAANTFIASNPNYSGLQQGTFDFDRLNTNTPTPTPTATPQPVSSLRGSVIQLSNCRYGPDWPYLYKYGVRVGTRMEVIGRDVDGNWLLVQGVGAHNSCWIKAVQIQVDGDVMSLPDAYPFTQNLPISPFFPEITISVSYSGGMVNVSWPDHEIRSDLGTEQGIEYIVEIWTCVDGKPTFFAQGYPPGETNASFQIDNSCGMISHADVIGEDKEGFSLPAQIVLP